jgi:hypothetical protein
VKKILDSVSGNIQNVKNNLEIALRLKTTNPYAKIDLSDKF